jgi:acyl-CoA synthetase (AMP-forming)/AMP-acid ligase II/uncharacterized protein YndB with AHSA1/START domain
VRIEEAVTVAAPPARVWEVVQDPVALARLSDLLTIEGDEQPGEGAQYRVLLHVGAVPVGGDVQVVDWQPGRELAWTALRGVDHRFRLRLREADGGCTRLTLRFGFSAPGLLGGLADLAAFGQVRAALRALLQAVARAAEGEAPPPPPGPSLLGRALREAGNLAVLARTGAVAPVRPDRLVRMALAARDWGPTLATAVAVGAARHGDRVALVDEDGPVTWTALDRESDALACALAAEGLDEGDALGLMARNHRGFVLTAAATAKCGADLLLLNTAFAAPQLRDVLAREAPAVTVRDAEFSGLVEGLDTEALPRLAEAHAGRRPDPPSRHGRVTILTSGTTGTPKGATRSLGQPTLDAPAGLLEAVPLRAGGTTLVAAPLFHAWGLANLALALGLGSTVVVRRRFDPEATLAAIAEHRCDAIAVVPVMLQRILELGDEVLDRHDTSSLRVVASSGSALPGALAHRWMDAFGDNLYNLYGSTEVASAAIAGPQDLRIAPGTAGRPPRGTTVKLLDEHGAEVRQGETGRIFVGSSAVFEGYTGGEDKDRVGGLVATGDVGRFDAAGRLFVEGRDDEMIVSGGENVFPKEVEDALVRHPAVAEAACVGVEDERFGQRLKAFVVLRGDADEAALQAHVKAELAAFKVPREVVVVDELPRNATGKVLKRELG